MKTQELLNQASSKVGNLAMLGMLYKAVNNYKRYSDITSTIVKSEFTEIEAEKFTALLDAASVNATLLKECPFPKTGDKVKKIMTAGWNFHFIEENLKEEWDYCVLVCAQGNFLYNRKMVEDKINNIELNACDYKARKITQSFAANYSTLNITTVS